MLSLPTTALETWSCLLKNLVKMVLEEEATHGHFKDVKLWLFSDSNNSPVERSCFVEQGSCFWSKTLHTPGGVADRCIMLHVVCVAGTHKAQMVAHNTPH